MREISSPVLDVSKMVQPISRGGTGSNQAAGAAVNLNLVTNAQKDVDNGVFSLNAQGKIPGSKFPSGNGVNKVNVDGSLSAFVNSVSLLQITDYDSFRAWSVSVSAGTVTRNNDVLTFTAPATAQVVTLTVNGRALSIQVNVPAPAQPSISAPPNGATNIGPSQVVTGSAFSPQGDSSTHTSSDWQLASDAAFTTVVVQSINDTTNKTTWTMSPPLPSTVYFLRCRYKGSNGNYSAYSTTVSFTTRSNFLPMNQEAIVQMNTAQSNSQGVGISISGDGLRVAACHYQASGDTGYLYVFSRTSGSWVQEHSATFTDKAATVGSSPSNVAIDSTGTRMAVASQGYYVSTNQSVGQVQMYSRSGTTWSIEQTISAPGSTPNTMFGQSIGFTAAGDRVVIGSRAGGNAVGAIYIWARTGASWAQEGTFGGGTTNSYYGQVVTISGDGTRVATRKPNENNIYVYLRTGVSWAQEQVITVGVNGTQDLYDALMLDGTGLRLFVGSTTGGGSAGSVKVYLRTGVSWALETSLVPTGGDNFTGNLFGAYLSCSGDGSIVAVTASAIANGGFSQAGAVFMFKRTGTSWAQQGAKMQETTPYNCNRFGYGLSLRSDGYQMAVLAAAPVAQRQSMFYTYN